MDQWDIMRARHSVRRYNDRQIDAQTAEQLRNFIADYNRESGMNFQLFTDEPGAFDSLLAHYGKFANVRNYVALVAKKSADTDEKLGYFGQKVVLEATRLGLCSCWVAMSFSRGKCAARIARGERLVCVIALGNADDRGNPHKSKTPEQVAVGLKDAPDWFTRGVEAALLAPTAMNQQKFRFVRDGNAVTAIAGMGFYTKVDLGIVKYHFELGAGKESFVWR